MLSILKTSAKMVSRSASSGACRWRSFFIIEGIFRTERTLDVSLPCTSLEAGGQTIEDPIHLVLSHIRMYSCVVELMHALPQSLLGAAEVHSVI